MNSGNAFYFSQFLNLLDTEFDPFVLPGLTPGRLNLSDALFDFTQLGLNFRALAVTGRLWQFL